MDFSKMKAGIKDYTGVDVDQIKDKVGQMQDEKAVRDREKLAKKLEKKGKSLDLRDQAEALYQSAVDDGLFVSFFKPGKGGVKDQVIEKLENMLQTLHESEEIQNVMVVGMNTSVAGLTYKPVPIIVTDNRIVCEVKNALAGAQKGIQLGDVSDVTAQKSLGARTVVIDSLKDKISFGVKTDQEAKAIVKAIQDALFDYRNRLSAPQVVQAQASAADELIKYKQLLDMGAISQDEFDAKKAELLGL